MVNSDAGFCNGSRWARKEEIQSSAMKIDLGEKEYPAAGLPVFCDGKTAYIDPSDTHTIIFGSTGSKKTRLFCFPMINMMIRAGESFVVTDPKGELYSKTSGAAAENGYKTVVLNFRDMGFGDCWNPLEIPYELYHNGKKDEAVSLMNDFISAISEPYRKITNDAFWVETAASLAIANMLLLMECGSKEEINLAGFANMCSLNSTSSLMNIAEYLDERTLAGANYKGVFSAAEKTRQSIQVYLYSWVRIFSSQKRLTQMLSTSTFDMRSIGDEKTAVYIIVPDEKTTYHFLVTTFIKQVYEALINEAQERAERTLPVRVNFILDEFCNIPAIPDMPAMISAARSRNMRYYLIVQGMNQLRAKYGEDAETIKGNCENRVFLTSKELPLLNEISELCGSFFTGTGEQRPLISVSELQRLDKQKGETLILYGRKYPFITELPDIDEYEMFKPKDTLPLKACGDIKYKTFSPRRVLDLLQSHDIVLFADELTAEEIVEERKEQYMEKFRHLFAKMDSLELHLRAGLLSDGEIENLKEEFKKRFDLLMEFSS